MDKIDVLIEFRHASNMIYFLIKNTSIQYTNIGTALRIRKIEIDIEIYFYDYSLKSLITI